MILNTQRLILRAWQASDAENLYKYAQDPRIGLIAGWPPHQSVEESAEIIATVFAQQGVYAVVLKETQQAIGCMGLLIGEQNQFSNNEREGEVAYWIGVAYWGKGLIPEATREIMRHAFEDLHLSALWCGYFDSNQQSKIAQEKCGFRHHSTLEEQYFEVVDAHHVQHISRISREEWLQG